MIMLMMMMMMRIMMMMVMVMTMMMCFPKTFFCRIIIAEASLDWLEVFNSFFSTYTEYGKSSPTCTKVGPHPFITSYAAICLCSLLYTFDKIFIYIQPLRN